MELSKDIVYYRLSVRYNVRYLNDNETGAKFGRPVFYTGENDPSGCVVICAHEADVYSFQDGSTECLLICLGEISELKNPVKSSVIVIEEEISAMEVFNSLQEIFNTFDRWDAELKTICSDGKSFGDLIDSCNPIICDPVCLSDNMFRYIGFSKALSDQRGLCASIDSNNRLSMDKVNNMFTEQRFASFDKLRGMNQIAPFGDVEGDLLFINIFHDDEYAGRLMMKLGREASENQIRYDKAILEHLYQYTFELYNKYSSFNQNEIYLNSLRSLLQIGLERKIIDAGLWDKVLEENGWSKNDTFQLVQIRPNLRYGKKMYADYFSTEIQSEWQGCACVDYQNHFMVFVNLQRFSTQEDMEFKQALAYFLRDSLLIAGISRVFNDVAYLYTAFRQTEVSLDFGIRENPTFWYYNFNDYVLDYILGNCTGPFEADQVCSEKLLSLKLYDEKNNTEYCKTLFVYLQCKFNSTAAAKKLIIQRSSFNYRMERIREIAHIDFDSNDEILYLQLSFKMLKMTNI